MDFKHIHIVGVGGTLMGAFAAFLRRNHVRVTGSDMPVYPPMSDVLSAAGVELQTPYAAENLDKIGGRPDLIVIGNVISEANPEMKAIRALGLPYISLPEFMEQHLLPKTRNLVVAGTHGKTTTASLLAHCLHFLGLSPSYFIGGVSLDLPHSFHVESKRPTEGGLFVLEGDEYDTAFWDKVPKFNHYLPNDVILTSIEYDHADIYPDFESVKKVFYGLMGRIRAPGRLIACGDHPEVLEAAKRSVQPVFTYGFSPGLGLDFQAQNYRRVDQEFAFDVFSKGKKVETVTLHLSGQYNALNALAVWVELKELGVDSKKAVDAIRSFRGVKRRQEERGEVRGVLVVDDFAHHPTAVRETLQGLSIKYSDRRLIAVFEPRSATSRRKIFQKEYAAAFDPCAEVYIAQAFNQAQIPEANQFSSQDLVQDLVQRGQDAHYFSSVDDGVKQLAKNSRSGDVIAVLSNGGFEGFIPKLLSQLSFG
jgi:UDP-N-acetylmuramate: L-alanyl-gamma-D-glutamyl-meso-diaminopimelate ligase